MKIVAGRIIIASLLLAGSVVAVAEETLPAETAATDATIAPPGSTVYRSVDSQGNTVFTDKPPQGGAAEAVSVKPSNAVPAYAPRPPEPRRKTGKPQAYTLFEIASPAQDQTLGQEETSVTLGVNIEPALQEGHTVELLYDGQVACSGSLTACDVQDLERGTHTVDARLYDQTQRLLMSAEPVQFHVRRTSSLNGNSKPRQPAETPSTLPADSPSPNAGMGAGGVGGFRSGGDANSGRDSRSAGGTRSSGGAGSTSGIGAPR